MIRRFFNAISLKNSEMPESGVPNFTITENKSPRTDFEVLEISHDEYARYQSNERRREFKVVVYDRRRTF